MEFELFVWSAICTNGADDRVWCKTNCSRNSQMSGAVRLHGITTPRIVISRCREARVSVGTVCPRPVRRSEVAAQAVLLIFYHAPSLIEAECRICKGPVNDTSVALAAVRAKAKVIGAENAGILDGASVGISLLIPVRLSTGIVAFLLQEHLMDAHVVAVPRPELPDVVDVVGHDYVCHLQLVPTVLGAIDAQLGWLGHQTFLGPDVLGLLFIGQGMPVVVRRQPL